MPALHAGRRRPKIEVDRTYIETLLVASCLNFGDLLLSSLAVRVSVSVLATLNPNHTLHSLHYTPAVLPKCSLHLIIDELQASINRHYCLGLILLQQHWSDLLVNVGLLFQSIKFLLDAAVLLLLGLKLLAGSNDSLELCTM